jgi:putative transposase
MVDVTFIFALRVMGWHDWGMPRVSRFAPGGVVFHVTNRGNGRMRVFRKAGDYSAFVELLAEGKGRAGVELFAYCLMPNHWHLVLRPRTDRDLAGYMSWVTNTHVKRYRAHYVGTSGHLYQGRYKSFPVQADGHLLAVLRYVEGNPVRGTKPLVEGAEAWEWSSLGGGRLVEGLVDAWPVERPRNWVGLVNAGQAEAELERIRQSVLRGRPLGEERWSRETARRLGLGHTLRGRGRPRGVEVGRAREG